MKTFFAAAATAAVMASGAFADTTQAGVVGASGDPVYTLEVTGTDGVTYNCRPEIETIAGVASRRCISANAGGLAGTGAGIGAGAGAAGVGLVVLAVAAGGSSSTTTTN